MLFYLKVSDDYSDYDTMGCLYYGTSNKHLRAADHYGYCFTDLDQAEREMKQLKVRRRL